MFTKAERKRVKLKLAITGPSGSGKTYSALRLAKGLGGSVAVIDTENGSASLYSDRFQFDVLEITPPYTVKKYLEALNAAVAAGYSVLVIDSLTHAWAGEGGLLAKKESMDARGGNSFVNWGAITKDHEQFKAGLLNAPIHMVCTMRSKQEYTIEANDRGKAAPKKVGMAPIQREGMEYEFTTVFDIAMNHEATASKDRTTLFTEGAFMVTEETGKALLKWLNSGAAEIKPGSVKAESPMGVMVGNGERQEAKRPVTIPPAVGSSPAAVLAKEITYGRQKGLRYADVPIAALEETIKWIRDTGKENSLGAKAFIEDVKTLFAAKPAPAALTAADRSFYDERNPPDDDDGVPF